MFLKTNKQLKIIECPRDAMQGIHSFIPTENKISYLNQLFKVGFDVLDCGSFVSPKVIPQMRDTAEVLNGIDRTNSKTKTSVIVASDRGAKEALAHKEVDILGYPFSISETFQQKNTHKTREKALKNISEIYQQTLDSDKKLLLYYSMAYGNPYNDKWDLDEIIRFTEKFAKMGITTINLSDTVAVATLEIIEMLFTTMHKEFPQIEFGAHLHTEYNQWKEKIELTYQLGCRRYDSAIKGFGGCPMANDILIGNMPTEKMINFIQEKKIDHTLNLLSFEAAYNGAKEVFQF